MSHCASGGATSGLWELVAWHPPGTHAAPVLPLTPRSWFPLRAFINDRVAARPLPAAATPTDLPPVDAVVRAGGPRPRDGSRPGGHVSQWGLFPSTQLDATVLLTASGSPSGWGTRSLTPLELASLWDVPISVTDSLSSVDDHGVLLGFCDSAPEKVLFAGADSLLTPSFRGGSIALGTSQGSVETVPGPTPFSNEALGLASQPGGGESEGGGGATPLPATPLPWRSSKETTRRMTTQGYPTISGHCIFSEVMARLQWQRPTSGPLVSPHKRARGISSTRPRPAPNGRQL